MRECASSSGFSVSELALASATRTLSLSPTLGAPDSSSDISILEPGLSNSRATLGGVSCSASEPFWFECDTESASGSWSSDSGSGLPDEDSAQSVYTHAR